MTKETETKNIIKDYLNLKGVFWWYNLAGIGSQRGIPDLFALHNGKLYAIEVKTPKGKLSDHQLNFLNRVDLCGGKAVIARSLNDVMRYI